MKKSYSKLRKAIDEWRDRAVLVERDETLLVKRIRAWRRKFLAFIQRHKKLRDLSKEDSQKLVDLILSS